MIDYYKILNVDITASNTEIKKRFRKLAILYHPDKNAGSKNTEEIFKVILKAYETLSDKEKRENYDLKYKRYFQKSQTKETFHNNSTDPKQDNKQRNEQTPNKQHYKTEHKKQPEPKQKINYTYFIIIFILLLIYLFSNIKNTTPKNSKAKDQFEEKQIEKRPQTGELDFKNNEK